MTEKLVRDVMHRGVITCGPRTSLRDVARIMIKNDVREIVVCTYRTAQMRGVISDWLLAQAHGSDVNGLGAEDIILPFTTTVSPDASLAEAMELMRKNRIHSLVVVTDTEEKDSNRPIGIISSYDIVKEMAEVELVFPHYRRW